MRSVLFLASFAALLCSCGKQEEGDAPPQATPSAIESWPATRQTEGGSYAVTLKPTAGEIRKNEHFSLDLTIEARGIDSSRVTVAVDADMPAHRHGMNTKPELVPKGELHYQADGMLFHMAGEWVVMVDVTAGGKTERASFPVEVE